MSPAPVCDSPARTARLAAHRATWPAARHDPRRPDHSPVLVTLQAGPSAPKAARGLITAMCWPLEDFLDVRDIERVTEHLVRHATPGSADGLLTFAVLVTQAELRIEVGTAGTAHPDPAPQPYENSSTGLVGALSDGSGARPFPGGTIAWARWELSPR